MQGLVPYKRGNGPCDVRWLPVAPVSAQAYGPPRRQRTINGITLSGDEVAPCHGMLACADLESLRGWLACSIFLTIGSNPTDGGLISAAICRGASMGFSDGDRIAKRSAEPISGITSTARIPGAITVWSSAKGNYGESPILVLRCESESAWVLTSLNSSCVARKSSVLLWTTIVWNRSALSANFSNRSAIN